MNIIQSYRWSSRFLGIIFSFIMLFSFGRVYTRVHTTMIGYKLGQLKSEESDLLEKRSRLQMELSRLTSKQYLVDRSK